MHLRPILALLALTTAAHAQQPWQHLQNPTAAEVQAAWKTPPPEYGPEPYYGLNGPFDLATVQRDLDTMQKLGFRAVTVQYGFGSKYPYLSPEYMQFFKLFVDEAKKRDMRIWIVDDAGYPSGFAGGKFTAEHPELRMQALVAQRIPIKVAGTFDQALLPGTVAATAIDAKTGESVDLPIVNGHAHWNAPSDTWTVYLVTHEFKTSPTRSDTNPKRVKDGSQSLEDYLDPAATGQYLKFTHEAYKAAVGDEFGKTILGFRGDEPDYSIAGLPWTPQFFARFAAVKGYDIRPYVAAFLQPKDATLTPRQLKAKADYYDVFALMFRDGFFKPQGDWCAANHLEYQVHLNHEEMELQLVRSEGDFFRDMRFVQNPGIDTIWHQIWTDTVSDFPRLAASAAHVYGHPRAFTESFAAYRPLPDVNMARYILNEQFVRGVNLVETMYFPATSTPGKGGPMDFMRDPAYPALMQYTSRLSYLMSMGKPAASVALLLPTASLWMGDTAADDAFVSTERLLSEHQIDFDSVDEDAFATVLKPTPDGALETASGNRLRTVIVPHASALSQGTLDRLRTLVRTGGHVLFLGGTPTQIAARTYLDDRAATEKDFAWATVTNATLAPTPTPPAYPPTAPPPPQTVPAELLAALKQAVPTSDLTLATPDAALRYIHRTLNGATVFLLFNESAAPIHNQLSLKAEGSKIEQWDPQTATTQPAAGAAAANGAVTLPLDLPPYATEILVVR
ncbi:alpha-L-rhamnosidase [Granulicella rosea]|uniref:Alpha-L-rhamnosidase n=1 Tax=Granulicella rosea TaxID=474952 RepID=A0A239M6W9_9BACT|nr:glycosyl hydrolase [Granulicella rosea]SNT38200.1 alpha-L-rhamnosidase [Granulicella rosea]